MQCGVLREDLCSAFLSEEHCSSQPLPPSGLFSGPGPRIAQEAPSCSASRGLRAPLPSAQPGLPSVSLTLAQLGQPLPACGTKQSACWLLKMRSRNKDSSPLLGHRTHSIQGHSQ